MSHLEKLLDKTFEPKKKAILHPPPSIVDTSPQKSGVSEKENSEVSVLRDITIGSDQPDSKLALDFAYLTTNSSFQRAIIEFIKRFIPGFENVRPRASKEIMTKSFNENIANYKLVMQELKEVLKNKKM